MGAAPLLPEAMRPGPRRSSALAPSKGHHHLRVCSWSSRSRAAGWGRGARGGHGQGPTARPEAQLGTAEALTPWALAVLGC